MTTAANYGIVLARFACRSTRFLSGGRPQSHTVVGNVHTERGKEQHTWYMWLSEGSATSPAPLWSHTACMVSFHMLALSGI